MDTEPSAAPMPKLRPPSSLREFGGAKKTMGAVSARPTLILARDFDSLVLAEEAVEGWIVLVTGVRLEAQEDGLHAKFGDCLGVQVFKKSQLNLHSLLRSPRGSRSPPRRRF